MASPIMKRLSHDLQVLLFLGYHVVYHKFFSYVSSVFDVYFILMNKKKRQKEEKMDR